MGQMVAGLERVVHLNLVGGKTYLGLDRELVCKRVVNLGHRFVNG